MVRRRYLVSHNFSGVEETNEKKKGLTLITVTRGRAYSTRVGPVILESQVSDSGLDRVPLNAQGLAQKQLSCDPWSV